jgi:hypothetical protein
VTEDGLLHREVSEMLRRAVGLGVRPGMFRKLKHKELCQLLEAVWRDGRAMGFLAGKEAGYLEAFQKARQKWQAERPSGLVPGLEVEG